MTRAFAMASAFAFAMALAGATARSARAGEGEAELDPPALFRSAIAALSAERSTDAIAKLEALSDRGVVDAALSYDRGLAYAERVRAGGEQPGDLGRAAHAFEEARALTHDPSLDRDAARALVAVRAEIAKRRSRAGESADLEHGLSLGRSIVGLLPENAWAILAALFAAATTAGIVVRARAAHASRARVAGTTTTLVAGALFAACALDVYFARDARLHVREGVVVATGRLLDARHVPAAGAAPVIEGARVTILADTGEFAHVLVGRVDGWLPSPSVLPLAKR